jgi:hypothetical protein
MADQKSATSQRLTQIKDFLTGNKTAMTLPWDPNSTKFPTRKELPNIPGAPEQAAWVWGEEDFVGRLNLLTPTRVAAASKEIKTGDIIPVKYECQDGLGRLYLTARQVCHLMCLEHLRSVANPSDTRLKYSKKTTHTMISTISTHKVEHNGMDSA